MTNRTTTRPDRRAFLCWCCAGLATTLTASTVGAQSAAAAGLTRTILSKQEFPGNDYVTLLVQVDVDPGFMVARHTHPGVESSYVITGGGTLSVKGQAARKLAPGDAFQIPPEVPHALQNDNAPTRLMITYVVDKNKPLASPAPE
jgi:quercetin dioxygenase-like cupin family protein